MSLNVRGLQGSGGNKGQRRRWKDLIVAARGVAILFLQETHTDEELSQEYTERLSLRGWSSVWTAADRHSGGVAILSTSVDARASIDSATAYVQGKRITAVTGSLNGTRVRLVSLYAPTKLTARRDFFYSLKPEELNPEGLLMILAGDFNCDFSGTRRDEEALQALARDWRLQRRPTVSATHLQKVRGGSVKASRSTTSS